MTVNTWRILHHITSHHITSSHITPHFALLSSSLFTAVSWAPEKCPPPLKPTVYQSCSGGNVCDACYKIWINLLCSC